jgi:hypothetical protein
LNAGFSVSQSLTVSLLAALDETNLDESVGLNGGAPTNAYGTRYNCGDNDKMVNKANGQRVVKGRLALDRWSATISGGCRPTPNPRPVPSCSVPPPLRRRNGNH